jgi:hypothetical protein
VPGKCRKDMQSLIKVIGETKVAAQARERDRPTSDNGLAVVISQIRKFLSTAIIWAQGLCLPNRLCFLGKELKEAAGRRDLGRRLETSKLTTRPIFVALAWPGLAVILVDDME